MMLTQTALFLRSPGAPAQHPLLSFTAFHTSPAPIYRVPRIVALMSPASGENENPRHRVLLVGAGVFPRAFASGVFLRTKIINDVSGIDNTLAIQFSELRSARLVASEIEASSTSPVSTWLLQRHEPHV